MDDLVEFYTSHRAEIESLLKEWTRRGQSRDARELFIWLCRNLLASAADWTERLEPAVKYLAAEAKYAIILRKLFPGLPFCPSG